MVATRRSSNVSQLMDAKRPLKKAKLDFHSNGAAPKASTSRTASKPSSDQHGELSSDTHNDGTYARPNSSWKVGAHVSAAGGVENAISNAVNIGANAFALFLKSQRKWVSPPLKESSVTAFKLRMEEFGYSAKYILPHGSYLINLGNPDAEKRAKSYDCFLDDLQRCEQLGLELYNLHPGSTVGAGTLAESVTHIATCINRAHKATENVVVVVENMAGAGNIIGSDFAHLAGIINEVEDKSRVGVCLDTCHMFAAGYDIRTEEGWKKTMSDFDSIVGMKYLRGMHLNDSKTPLNSKRDRHENIGLGHIGLLAFHHILTDPCVQHIPLILETPTSEEPAVWAAEIKVLNELSGLPVDSVNSHQELLDSIRAISKKADAKSGTGKSSKPKASTQKRKSSQKKRKAKDDVGDDEDEDKGDSDASRDD